jgi:AAA domain-containing protein
METTSRAFQLETWLQEHDVPIRRADPYEGGTRWLLTACPFDPSHTNGEAAIGKKPNGAIWFKCQHNSCTDQRWQDARQHFEPGWRPATPTTQKLSAVPKEVVAAERNETLFVTAREVGEQAPAHPEWIVPGYAAPGAITECDGKIKVSGKTTFALAMTSAVVDGKPFLGRETKKTSVVILTEQPQASFAAALRRASLHDRDDVHVLYHHRVRGRPWSEVATLAHEKCRSEKAQLLIIDTVSQFAGLAGDDENSSGKALEAAAPLQAAAADNMAVWVNPHDRKSGGDVGESGRGSSAFSGAVDIVLQLHRGEGNSSPNLRIIESLSRFDETPASLAIELGEHGYEVLGDSSAVAETQARRALMDSAPSDSDKAMTTDELMVVAKIKRTVCQRALKTLEETGAFRKVGKGLRNDPHTWYRTLATDAAEEKLAATTTSLYTAETNGVTATPLQTSQVFLPQTHLVAAERNGHDGAVSVLCDASGRPWNVHGPADEFGICAVTPPPNAAMMEVPS